jgi:hypothetical protein
VKWLKVLWERFWRWVERLEALLGLLPYAGAGAAVGAFSVNWLELITLPAPADVAQRIRWMTYTMATFGGLLALGAWRVLSDKKKRRIVEGLVLAVVLFLVSVWLLRWYAISLSDYAMHTPHRLTKAWEVMKWCLSALSGLAHLTLAAAVVLAGLAGLAPFQPKWKG